MTLRRQYREAMLGPGAASIADGRLPFLMNDLVIEDQLCHLKCTYCLTEDFNLLMAVPDARERLRADHRATWHEVLDGFHQHVDCPILRMSGGEFFWLRNSVEFVAEVAERYETVQVISNGVTLKPKRLEALAKVSKFQLNLSLDGHTLAMNRHRFPNQGMLDVILKHLDIAIGLGIRVEIQSVLTDANVAELESFCEFLVERYADRIRLYVFPARGENAQPMLAPPGDDLWSLVERYDEFGSILPPKPYLEHMARFMSEGVRTLPCAITGAMLQLFGDGDFSACPHAWIDRIGNVVEDDILKAAASFFGAELDRQHKR